MRTTAARRACENSRPIAAPICATSLAGPSRSSRAINEACKLAGTARAGDGTAATVRQAAPSPSASSTAFVISSTNRGMPSVRSMISASIPAGSALFPARRVDHGGRFTLPKPIQRQARHMRLSHPRRVELGTECDDQQYRKGFNPVHDPAERFQARRIDPMRILENHQHRLAGKANSASCEVSASSVLCLRCSGASSSAG